MKTLILVTFTGERRLSSDLCQCVSCDYVTALDAEWSPFALVRLSPFDHPER